MLEQVESEARKKFFRAKKSWRNGDFPKPNGHQIGTLCVSVRNGREHVVIGLISHVRPTLSHTWRTFRPPRTGSSSPLSTFGRSIGLPKAERASEGPCGSGGRPSKSSDVGGGTAGNSIRWRRQRRDACSMIPLSLAAASRFSHMSTGK